MKKGTINYPVDFYFFFMWNRWDERECHKIFGEMLGNHLWNKWITYCQEKGSHHATSKFYAELDCTNREILVEYCIQYYQTKQN